MIAEGWMDLSDPDDKQKYAKMAEKDKERYDQELLANQQGNAAHKLETN